MQPEQSARLEHILEHIPVGVAILDCTDLRLLYANTYFVSLLQQHWQAQGVIGHPLEEVLPSELREATEPRIQEVCATGQSTVLSDIPYEGFLETRGRTYWRISIEPFTPSAPAG